MANPRPRLPRTLRAVALVALAAALTAADQPDPNFGPNDVPTVFFISKSDDESRVDYGVSLDPECQPAGKEPVVGYWHEFEKGVSKRTHSFHWYDYMAYGIRDLKVEKKSANSAEITLRLKAVERDIVFVTGKTPGGKCAVKARTTIGKVANADLTSAYVKLKRALSVEYVELRGKHPATGEPLTERLDP